MTKRLLMIFLGISFLVGIIAIIIFFRKSIPGTSVSVPLPKPTIAPLEPTPTAIPKLLELETDLDSIEKDLDKMKREDKRFTPPPTFIFDLGLQ